jgi:hypothetical protein
MKRRVVKAACWAHMRRKFFDVYSANGSAVAKESLDRIGALYGVEAAINGMAPDERHQRRQAQSRPIAEALKTWAEETTPKLSGRSELAAAFCYMSGTLMAARCPRAHRRPPKTIVSSNSCRGIGAGRAGR